MQKWYGFWRMYCIIIYVTFSVLCSTIGNTTELLSIFQLVTLDVEYQNIVVKFNDGNVILIRVNEAIPKTQAILRQVSATQLLLEYLQLQENGVHTKQWAILHHQLGQPDWIQHLQSLPTDPLPILKPSYHLQIRQ